MDWATISAIIGGVFAMLSYFTYMINHKFDALDSDVKSAIARFDQRIDQSNQRIDQTQAIIMRMYEREKQ